MGVLEREADHFHIPGLLQVALNLLAGQEDLLGYLRRVSFSL